jgi:tRNA dimethylallyltransferase
MRRHWPNFRILIDLISPEEAYSAARFRADALAAMAEITARGRVPLLVGGTMLYFKALSKAWSICRQPTRQRVRRSTRKPLPAVGRRCTPNSPGSTRQPPRGCTPCDCAAHPARARGLSPFRPPAFGADRHRRQAGATIPLPVDWPAAVRPRRPAPAHRRSLRAHARRRAGSRSRGLRQKYRLRAELPSMRCVGYRQVWDVQAGLAPRGELRDRGIYATRQLAKRQITWIGNTLQPQIVDCRPARRDAAGLKVSSVGFLYTPQQW